jgi:VWFA-related protein
MIRHRTCVGFVLMFLLRTAAGQAQGPSPSSLPSSSQPGVSAPVFHAETRLVVVDVVVTNGHGQPVTELEKPDFTLLEDGKPQQIKIFEAHTPPAQPKAIPKIELPPNQYTNFPTKAPGSSINIVLFDVLNTPTEDQIYARRQMVQFLKSLPRGQQVALFQLDKELHMIAGFNSSSDELVAAASRLLPGHSPLLDTDEEKQATEDLITSLEQSGQPPPHPGSDPGGLANSPGGGDAPPSMFEFMRQFEEDGQIVRDEARARITLDAFAELARAVSGYSGRKNLLWLSESFPISFGPNLSSFDPMRNVGNELDIMRETSGLLSSYQISVYPIDIRGMKVLAPAITGSGLSVIGNRGGKSRYSSMIDSKELELQNVHDGMRDIAEQTGGEAFYNTNDLKLAMQDSMQSGSNYYTLAYVPNNLNWNSKYRHIDIKLARPGVKTQSRKGYFAIPELQAPETDSRNRLIAAMQPGVPTSTMLLLRVQVLPPDAKSPKVKIDYGVYAPDLAFTDGAQSSKQGKVEFVAVAWDKANHSAGNVSETMDLSFKQEHYDAVMKNGLSAHLELELKPGNYTLRLGVMDYGNGKIGIVDVPLSIADNTRAQR